MLQEYKGEVPGDKPGSWAELSAGWKWVWIGSFLLAFLAGIGMGLYLTFA